MTTVVELDRAPSMGPLFRRAVIGLLPGRGKSGVELPDTRLMLSGVGAQLPKLAEYARVCGFPLTGTLPGTYPHVLAFPLALSLMTRADFPFPAAGMVHVANRITQHHPVPVEASLDLSVHAAHLRPHDRGRQVDLVTEATMDGDTVWREVSTYLHKEKGATAPQEGSPAQAASQEGSPAQVQAGSGEPSSERVGSPTAVWRVGADVGSEYAAISGDRNPIHTSIFAARAFGFRRRIAHGMWTKARCLAQLGPRLPDAYEVDVRFQAPLLLPSTVHFTASPADDGWTIAVRHGSSGKPHLAGATSTA